MIDIGMLVDVVAILFIQAESHTGKGALHPLVQELLISLEGCVKYREK